MDTVYCRSSRALPFSSMNPISTYTSAAKTGFPSTSSLKRKVDTHAFQRRTSTMGLERRKRCYVHLNASLEPKSESTEKETGSSPQQAVLGESVQAHLDLLQRFTSDSGLNTAGKTIAQQLQEDLEQGNVEELTVPLGNGKVEMELTISQKRNIRRQNYLNQVSKRNDAPFFTTVALFVIVPPVVILGVAVATGYVDLVP